MRTTDTITSTRLRDLCDPATATVEPTATLRAAAEVLAADGVGAALVADARGLLGLISERDIVRVAADGLDLDEERVEDHMTDVLIGTSGDTSAAEGLRMLVDAEVRHLLVDDRLVVSMRRLVTHLLAPTTAG
jgi:CBS domain-containing protein